VVAQVPGSIRGGSQQPWSMSTTLSGDFCRSCIRVVVVVVVVVVDVVSADVDSLLFPSSARWHEVLSAFPFASSGCCCCCCCCCFCCSGCSPHDWASVVFAVILAGPMSIFHPRLTRWTARVMRKMYCLLLLATVGARVQVISFGSRNGAAAARNTRDVRAWFMNRFLFPATVNKECVRMGFDVR
jgi:hypothetical protein